MIILDEIKEEIDIMLHPTDIKKGMDFRSSFKYYYKLSVVPFFLFVILGLLFNAYNGFGQLPQQYFIYFGGNPYLFYILFSILLFFVLIPISIVINSALYHFVGKNILKSYKGSFDDTVTATTYASGAVVLATELQTIPHLGFLILLFVLWEFVLLIIGLSKLQKTTMLRSFGIVIVTILLAVIIASVAFSAYTFFSVPGIPVPAA